MSHNQSRAEKTEGHLRRPGRSGNFGQNRGFSCGGKGGGASDPSTALQSSAATPLSSASHEFSTDRSYKKSVNGQGEQTRANRGSSNSDEAHRPVPNGSYAVTCSHGPSVRLESGGSKPADALNIKKIPRAVPKTPTEPVQSAAATPGDEPGPFLQFGTISPRIMNGMQIPARTCSAPPNLDEQKRHQTSIDSVRAAPAVPVSSAPRPHQALQQPHLPQKQQQSVKDVGAAKQIGNREPLPPTQPNMHASITSTPSATSARPVLNLGGMPMHVPVPVPFQPPQIPLQFRGPNLQMSSQGIAPTSIQMTMTMSAGNVPQVPQPMFVNNIQSHSLQPPSIMHQGQSLGFAPQLAHQLPPQLGSMGVSLAQQFHQQQPANFVSQRKAVKITHPETHEELKLDKRTDMHTDTSTSGQRQLPSATSHSQSLPTFNHQISYYPTAYNTSSMFFPSPLNLSNTQRGTAPQAARYSYPVGQNGQTMSFMNSSSLNPVSASRPGAPHSLHGLSEAVNSEMSSVSVSLAAPAQVTIKPPILSSEKVGTQSVRITMPISKPESPKKFKLSSEVPIAIQLKDKEVGPQSTATVHQRSCEPSFSKSSSSTSDKNLAKESSMLSMHVNKSESSYLVPSFIGSSPSIVEEKDENKKEALKSESLKDHQKISSTRELKHSQQQTKSLECTGSMTLDPAEIVNSNSMEATVGHATSSDSASIHSAPATDSFTSATSLQTMTIESRNSELDQKIDMVGASGPSRDALDEKSSEASCSNSFNSVAVADDRFSFEGTGFFEVCTSSTDVDGINFGIDISLESFNILDDGQKQQNLTEPKCERESYGDVLLGSISPKLSSVSKSIESSDEVPMVVIMEAEKRAGSQICAIDDLQSGSIEEGGNCLEIVKLGVPYIPISTISEEKNTNHTPYDQVPRTDADDNTILFTDSSTKKCEVTYENVAARELGVSLSEISLVLLDSEMKQMPEIESVDHTIGETPSVFPVSRDKPSLPPIRSRNNKKKKKKENLLKADAAGSYDLYDAYKGPNEKLDTICTPETMETSSSANLNSGTVEGQSDIYVEAELSEQSKAEVEDWEDAADESTPKLRSDNSELVDVEKNIHVEYGNESTGKKKYSRDFLFTFSEQCRDLPEGFEVGTDIADVLICVQAGMDALPSPGRIIDRSLSASRGDRRMAGFSEDDKRMKGSNAFRMDIGHGVSAVNFRPVQGANHGVLRNPRLQSPTQFYGGILSGPMHSLASQGSIARNSSDADRWQRATGAQRGLMPPPQGPMQVMHKSANRYEVGKVSDEEEQKQRQLKAILNKLTPQNFDKLFTQVKEVNIDNTVTLTGIISQIFDKALMEPTFCEMYADFCHHLASDLPDFFEDNEKITFRRLLLNKCQEEFERGEREEAEADKAEEEGETHQSEAEREDKRIRTRRRMLGNIRLIGELYKKKMLTERIMHECIKKLLGQYQNLDEENIEALCKLMSTIGEMIDHSKSREHMDVYFDMIAKLSTNQKLSSRVRFMLKDTIDLRKNRWQQRRKVEGPKKIEDVHKDAAQERQSQTSRTSRGPIITSKRGPPVDYGHRGSTILSSSQLSGSIRALPGQTRAASSQDVRLDDRNQYESRVLSVPLSQRHSVGGSITLGPQGGLAKGMSGRGQGLMSNVPLAEIATRVGDSQRSASGSNGFSLTHDRILSTSKDESMPKYMPDRSSGVTNDQASFHDNNSIFGNRDSRLVERAVDLSGAATSGRRPDSSGGKMSISEAKILSEDVLREKSISAIREFYSAKDESEVVLCIRDLNMPSFYPSVVSLWVSDSFERKNMERSLLAQLLVNLSRGHDSLISSSQLIEGFEYVLSSLEDAVNDAPKAAEFLGQIFGKVIMENLIPLMEIGKLILRCGEVPGSLVEVGLGSEILGSIFEFVKMEKGDSILNEIRRSSNLTFEEFRPPRPSAKSMKLDAFL